MEKSPYEVLGLSPAASAEQIRTQYRELVKKNHPDRFPAGEMRERAQATMTELNLAYEKALQHCEQRRAANPYHGALELRDAMILAKRMMAQHGPESALRQLMRAETRDAEWYAYQGEVLLAMKQYQSAIQSYREAVRREPDNNTYRSGALAAEMALKRSKTLAGKIRKILGK